MRKPAVIAAAAVIAATALTAACGAASTVDPGPQFGPGPAASTPATIVPGAQPATAPDTQSLKAAALALAARAGCPNPPDLAANGAAGAFPGAPSVNFTCAVGGSSVSVDVFGSHADEQANLAYRTANIGGTLITGTNFIASVYDSYPVWAQRLGGTVR